jgi:hypothetical protein
MAGRTYAKELGRLSDMVRLGQYARRAATQRMPTDEIGTRTQRWDKHYIVDLGQRWARLGERIGVGHGLRQQTVNIFAKAIRSFGSLAPPRPPHAN